MQTTFNLNLWLLHTGLLMALMLLAIPTIRTLFGLLLIVLSQGLKFERLRVRKLGIRLLPSFMRGILGLSLGLGLTGLGPAAAEEVVFIDRVSSIQEPANKNAEHTFENQAQGAESDSFFYEVQPGDSLWSIASKTLSQYQTSPSIGDVDVAWRDIWSLNKSVVGSDPGLIRPGMKLEIRLRATAKNAE
jgi:hypothetical protein